MKKEILNAYYELKQKQSVIAKNLNVSAAYITKIIKQDARYKKEKNTRKENNKIKHTDKTKKYIKEKRDKEKLKTNVDDLVLKQMHNQASMELSKGNKLSDMAYRNWNTSAYTYNKDKKQFEFRKELGRSYAIKKVIKERF